MIGPFGGCVAVRGGYPGERPRVPNGLAARRFESRPHVLGLGVIGHHGAQHRAPWRIFRPGIDAAQRQGTRPGGGLRSPGAGCGRSSSGPPRSYRRRPQPAVGVLVGARIDPPTRTGGRPFRRPRRRLPGPPRPSAGTASRARPVVLTCSFIQSSPRPMAGSGAARPSGSAVGPSPAGRRSAVRAALLPVWPHVRHPCIAGRRWRAATPSAALLSARCCWLRCAQVVRGRGHPVEGYRPTELSKSSQ
jgi:hypothetical protein